MLTISPTFSAARAPASTAARQAATSPRTIAVTYPPPIFSNPTRSTFAAFTIASAASTIALNPRVSIIPSASPAPGAALFSAIPRSFLFYAGFTTALNTDWLCRSLKADSISSSGYILVMYFLTSSFPGGDPRHDVLVLPGRRGVDAVD